jgi:uncharacterized caspase-like protein
MQPLLARLVVLLILVVGWMPAKAVEGDILVLGGAPERRVALVLGNASYTSIPSLANPVRDAQAVAAKLGDLGFEVVSGFDLSKAQTQETIAKFARAVRGADIAAFFYAGHGVQVAGRNYLLPVDAVLQDEMSLDFETVQIDFILRQMSRETGVRLVFLDACRDNPLADAQADAIGASGGGLAEIQIDRTGSDMLIAFATSPNEVAYDGSGDHSPFSTALLAHLGEPNTPLTIAMTKVTGDVVTATGGRQRPWLNVSLTGEVMLNRQAEAAPQVAAAPSPEQGSSTRTPAQSADQPAVDEAQVALNLLRQQIPRLESDAPVLFDRPVQFGDPQLDGRSLAQLIEGIPLHSPIEGLDQSAWQVHCSGCHNWTKDTLCDQAKAFQRIDVSVLRLQHPYGPRFKVALSNWADNDCQ